MGKKKQSNKSTKNNETAPKSANPNKNQQSKKETKQKDEKAETSNLDSTQHPVATESASAMDCPIESMPEVEKDWDDEDKDFDTVQSTTVYNEENGPGRKKGSQVPSQKKPKQEDDWKTPSNNKKGSRNKAENSGSEYKRSSDRSAERSLSRDRNDAGQSQNRRSKGTRWDKDSPRSEARSRRDYEAEYQKFSDLLWSKREISYEKFKEEEGDLFTVPGDYSLAHCVAEDMSMGSGIAVTFRQMFKRVDELLNQHQKTGGLATLEEKNGRYIYYLVTKKHSTGKPTLSSLFSSLIKMKDHMLGHNVNKLAIPRIGCGLDRLEWSDVKKMLQFLFQNAEVEILVCNFQQNYGKTKQKLKQKSDSKAQKDTNKKEHNKGTNSKSKRKK